MGRGKDEVVDEEVEDEVVDYPCEYKGGEYYRLFVESPHVTWTKNKPFGFSFKEIFFQRLPFLVFFLSRQTTFSGPKRSGSIPEKKKGRPGTRTRVTPRQPIALPPEP